MLTETTNLILKDLGLKHDIECEIVPGKEEIKMKSGDRVSYIKMDEIYALALMILKPEQQDSLIPIRQTRLTKFRKQHHVRVKKDIRKGQEVVVNCEIDVPTVVEENIRAFLKPKTSLLIP